LGAVDQWRQPDAARRAAAAGAARDRLDRNGDVVPLLDAFEAWASSRTVRHH
jgi:hypothetical protein